MDFSTLALLAFWIAASWAWGRAFLPLSRQIFPTLLDGGLAAGRLLALILVALLAFEGAALHILSLQLSPLLVLGAPLAAQLWLRRDAVRLEDFHLWARQKKSSLAISDAIFVGAWILFAWIRLQNPVLSDLEKPMDIGLLASATRATWLPFETFWRSGVPFTNYYYFFPVAASLPTRTLATPPHIAYNLVQPLFCALFVSILSAFCASMCRPQESRLSNWGAWARGLWAMAIVALLGHFEPLRQMKEAGRWLWPSELDWWKTSRVIANTINEYPAFTQIDGDAHAHFFALSTWALIFSLAWSLFSSPQELPQVLDAVDTDDAHAPQVLGATPARKSGNAKRRRATARASANVNASTSVQVLEADEESATLQVLGGSARDDSQHEKRRWARVLLLGALIGALVLGNTWDAPLAILLCGACIVLSAHRAGEEMSRRQIMQACGRIGAMLGLAFVLALPYLLRFRSQVQGVKREMWRPSLSEWALLWIGIVVLAILAYFGAQRIRDSRRTLWQVLAFCGVLALAAPHAFFIVGFFGSGPEHALRHQDTVFKFGLQAWILLGTAGACGTWWLLDSLRANQRRAATAGWVGAWTIPLMCTLCVVYTRTVAQKSPHAPTLDGTVGAPLSDGRAAAWLGAHAPRGSVVLEAVRPGGSYYSYEPFGRASSLSGVPTLMGWTQHAWYWGADMERDIAPRLRTVESIWRAPDVDTARQALRASGVTHIFLGELERSNYPGASQVLGQVGRVAFQDGETKVIEVGP